jgi:RsiW-degrading membrane proteinase PrsW (M82 family)
MQYIAVAVAPGLAICLYFFYKDIYNREPKLNLIMSFIFGAAAIVPAIYFETYFSYTADGTVAGVAVFSYAIVAFSEEFCKFIGLRFYAYNQKSFDEPLDGIVYGVIVSMGFATIENLLYVLKAVELGQGWEVGIKRMLLSVPAHATFGVVMGYFVGRAKFDPKNSLALMTAGIVSAVILHGSFDFFLFVYQTTLWGRNVGATLLVGGALTSFVISIVLSRRLFRRQQLVSRELFSNKTTGTGVGDT